ncbi:FimB/Mfa2 family fimbrial subunit [Sphingobacterium sp. HMA12]|uniref:FimB/Mfa2 family fimbrial subunit n=1 Tax=Sphingobacterium sp. HMA12 TaxID=2050894 RepID=UPI000CEA3B7B|nr:FimB/Mfa2 family fimbrial subunit [Sphingobacterium sp. HMA12]
MKKLLTLWAITPILFASCAKKGIEAEPKQKNELYEVKLSTTGLEQSIKPIGLKSSTTTSPQDPLLKDEITGVEFFVFDNLSNLVGQTYSNFYDANGNFIAGSTNVTMELPKGSYYVSAVARDGYHTDFYYLNTHLQNFYIDFPSTYSTKEIVQFSPIFIHKQSPLTVGTTAVNHAVQMKRLNAQLEIKINDEIPEHVDYILFGGKIAKSVLLFDQIANASGSGYIKLDLNSIRTQTEKVLTATFYPNAYSTDKLTKQASYEVLYYDKNNKLLGTKTISDVQFKQSHITRLTGNLFDTIEDPLKSTGMRIDFIKDYSPTIIEKKF